MILKKTAAAALAFFLLALAPASACTLFGAQGSEVEGGGTLLVKNRDWHPQYQEMRYEEGPRYRFYGIFGGSSGKMFLRGGVNEAGLAVFQQLPAPFPKRKDFPWNMRRKAVSAKCWGNAPP